MEKPSLSARSLARSLGASLPLTALFGIMLAYALGHGNPQRFWLSILVSFVVLFVLAYPFARLSERRADKKQEATASL